MSPPVPADHRRAMRALRWGWLPGGQCLLFGLFLVGVGVVLLADPTAGERLFGFGDTGGTANGFLLATGVRQAYLGVLVLLLWRSGQRRALGIVLCTLVIVPVADFLVALAVAGAGLTSAAEHLLGLVVLPLGLYVLRADRRRAVGGPVGGEGRRQR
jgi:Domain of unknown function (DUF4267)